MSRENIYNIPNLLSAYRLVALPFIVWAMALGSEEWFILLLSINLITDILDGFIARRFKLETKLGAKLDSIADLGTYLAAVAGMIVLEKEFVDKHAVILIILISLYLLPHGISLVRFRRAASFHLYSSKVIAYVQGIFIFTFFNWGAPDWFFYLMIVLSYISYLEEAITALLIKESRSNVKSLCFVLKATQKPAKWN